jgi:biotin synthase-related radical SAM superfamily protein
MGLRIAASVDALGEKIVNAVRNEIKKRFKEAVEKKKHAEESVEEGREFVESYVQYFHFIEGIHNMVAKGAPDRKASELTSRVNSKASRHGEN